MHREEIDEAAWNDEKSSENSSEFARYGGSRERKMPQSPQRKCDEKIRDNYPDMNKFLIGQNLDRELEAKGNGNEAQTCQKKTPLQISRENQRQRNQQPLESKGEAKIISHIRHGRMIDGVTPVKEFWHLRSTAPGAQVKHLRERDHSGNDR